jgi:hypothetical protein
VDERSRRAGGQSRAMVRILGQDGSAAQRAYSLELPLVRSISLDRFDQLDYPASIGFGGEVSPAREGREDQRLLGRKLARRCWRGLTGEDGKAG